MANRSDVLRANPSSRVTVTTSPRGKVIACRGAKTDRQQLRRVIAALQPGDVLMVTRLDRLARSTRDLLSTLAAITDRTAGFRSLGDAWADTTTSHGRLTPHQQREAIKRRAVDGEPIRDIARSYNVHNSTISRLASI